MPVLDPSSPGNSAHPLRRGKLAALAALTTLALALLGGTGCVAEVHTRTVTPAPATVTYQEFAVVEEPVVHIAAAPVHVETYPRVYTAGPTSTTWMAAGTIRPTTAGSITARSRAPWCTTASSSSDAARVTTTSTITTPTT